MLTSLGGVAGILFGWIISLISRLVFPSLPGGGAAVGGGAGDCGFGECGAVLRDLAGVAARLDPVEALRYESGGGQLSWR